MMSRGLKERKTPPSHPASHSPLPSTCPFLLHLPLHALLSNELSRTPVQMALHQPAPPVGAAGMGGFLALCPYHHPESQQEAQMCIGVETEYRGAGAGPIWPLSCTVTAWQRRQKRYHTYAASLTLQQNQTSTQVSSLCLGKKKNRHACTFAPTHGIELPSRHSSSPPIPQSVSVV